MNKRTALTLVCLGAAGFASLAGGCQTSETTVTTVWKSPEALKRDHFKKIAMVVTNATAGERRAAEDQLAAETKGGRGFASYPFLPDEDLKDSEKVWKSLEAQGFDGAVVLRLVGVEKQETYYPPTYLRNTDPFVYNYRGYYTYGAYASYTPGYTETTRIIHAEISVHVVSDRSLIWAGSSTTEDPNGIRDMVRQVAEASIAELKRQGLLPNE